MATILTDRHQVTQLICKAIDDGRQQSGDWSFPSDCFCSDLSNRIRTTYQFDIKFLDALCFTITKFASEYPHDVDFLRQ